MRFLFRASTRAFFGFATVIVLGLLHVRVPDVATSYIKLPLDGELSASLRSRNHGPEADRPTILVTGGMGNIGKYVVRELLDLDHDVIVLDVDDRSDELQELLEEREIFVSPSRLRFVRADIRNGSCIISLLRAGPALTGIIHLAAIARLATCLSDEAECYSVNADGTKAIADAVASHIQGGEGGPVKPWIIFASSREIYGESCDFLNPCNERSLPSPINLYGATKLKGERYLQAAPAAFAGTVILRFSSVYGGRYDLPGRLIPTLVAKAMSDGLVDLMSDDAVFDFVHVTDVVASVLQGVKLLMSQQDYFNDFLVCSGRGSSSGEVLSFTQRLAGGNSPVRLLPQDQRFPKHFVCDNAKMKTSLRHTPRFQDLKRGLAVYMHGVYKRDVEILEQTMSQECTQLPALDVVELDGCRVLTLPFDGTRRAPEVSERKPISATATRSLLLRRWENSKTLFTLQDEVREHVSKREANALYEALRLVPSEDTKLRVYTLRKTSEHPHDALEPDVGYEFPAPTHIWPYACPERHQRKWHISTSHLDAVSSLFVSWYSGQNIALNSTSRQPCPSFADAIRIARRGLEACTSTLRLATPFNDNVSVIIDDIGDDILRHDNIESVCDADCRLSGGCVVTKACRCPPAVCDFSSRPAPQYTQDMSQRTAAESSRQEPNSKANELPKHTSVLTTTAAAFEKKWVPPKVHFWQPSGRTGMLETGDVSGTVFDKGECPSTVKMLYTAFRRVSVPLNESELVFSLIPDDLKARRGKQSQLFSSYIHHMTTSVKPGHTPDYEASGFFSTTQDHFEISRHLTAAVEAPEEQDDQPNLHLRRRCSALRPFEDHLGRDHSPHMDLVVPSLPCISPASVSNEAEVKPVLQRKHFVFLPALSDDGGVLSALIAASLFRRKHDKVFVQTSSAQGSAEALNDSVFCPHILRTSGWAHQLQESINHGCIPVLASDVSHLPFRDVLDWKKFAVFVDAEDLQEVEDVLMSITPEELRRKQDVLLKVRQCLEFQESAILEEVSGKRLGPVFLTLLTLRLRLATRHPETPQ